jgi:hypothetical protein
VPTVSVSPQTCKFNTGASLEPNMTLRPLKYPYLPLRLHTDTSKAPMPVSHSSMAERPLAVPTVSVRPQTSQFNTDASLRTQYDIYTLKYPYMPLRLHTDTNKAPRPVSHSIMAEMPLAVPTVSVRLQTSKFNTEAQYDIETPKIPLSATETAYRH